MSSSDDKLILEDVVVGAEFWIGFGVGSFLILVVVCLVICCGCCCGNDTRYQKQDTIEIELDEEPTEIMVNGAHYSVEKRASKVVLKPKPIEPEETRKSRFAQSMGQGAFKLMPRQGPRFSYFYSGNSSSGDELSNPNKQLFRKSEDGSDMPTSPPHNSGSTALSNYLKKGMNFIDQGMNKGKEAFGRISSRRQYAAKDTEVEEVIVHQTSNLLRKSPETDEQGDVEIQVKKEEDVEDSSLHKTFAVSMENDEDAPSQI